MIRSPQAFLVSLSLHVLMGAAILFVVAPRIPSPEEGEMQRCLIALSHVVPVAPPSAEKSRPPAKAPARKRVEEMKKRPEKKAVTPVKTVPAAVEKPVKPAAVPEEPLPAVEAPAEAEAGIAEASVAEAPAAEALEAETAETVPPAVEAPSVPAETQEALPPRQTGTSYVAENLAVIARLLKENLYYPKLARKRHIEGEVVAAFTLQTDGTIRNVTVKKHARDVLDRAAVRTIKSLSGLLPHPQSPLTLEVPIRFVLR
jgi:periplasmic protein TonB